MHGQVYSLEHGLYTYKTCSEYIAWAYVESFCNTSVHSGRVGQVHGSYLEDSSPRPHTGSSVMKLSTIFHTYLQGVLRPRNITESIGAFIVAVRVLFYFFKCLNLRDRVKYLNQQYIALFLSKIQEKVIYSRFLANMHAVTTP